MRRHTCQKQTPSRIGLRKQPIALEKGCGLEHIGNRRTIFVMNTNLKWLAGHLSQVTRRNKASVCLIHRTDTK